MSGVRWVIGVALLLVILLTPLWLLRVVNSDAELVQNGLQSFEICGKARASEGADPMSSPLASDILAAAPVSRKGVWNVRTQDGCDTFVHYPPDMD